TPSSLAIGTSDDCSRTSNRPPGTPASTRKRKLLAALGRPENSCQSPRCHWYGSLVHRALSSTLLRYISVSQQMLMNVDTPGLELPQTRDDRLVSHSHLRKIRTALLAVDGAAHWRDLRKRRYGIDRFYLCVIQRPRQRARTPTERWCEHGLTDCLYELRKSHLPGFRLPEGDRESGVGTRWHQILPARNDRMLIDLTAYLARIQHCVEIHEAMKLTIHPDGEPQTSRKTLLAFLIAPPDSQARPEQTQQSAATGKSHGGPIVFICVIAPGLHGTLQLQNEKTAHGRALNPGRRARSTPSEQKALRPEPALPLWANHPAQTGVSSRLAHTLDARF